MTMLKRKRIRGIVFLLIIVLSCIPKDISGWYQDIDYNEDSTLFSTHQWLSFEAIKMFPEQKIQWITQNIQAFWNGVKAPLDGNISINYMINGSMYSDIDYRFLYLDSSGLIVTNDSLAVRAFEEYNKALSELSNGNYILAAFYAGAMSHYIAQAGFWGAIWNETQWGHLSYVSSYLYQNQINDGRSRTLFPYHTDNFLLMDLTGYYNEYFTLHPAIPAQSIDAYNATINLAKNIHPDAQYLGDNFDVDSLTPLDWSELYRNETIDCLTYSVEAIYTAVEKLVLESDLNYLELPTPIYTFNETTFKLSIPEFQADYINNETVTPLNDSLVEFAQVRYLYYDYDNEPSELSTDHLDLQYNDTSKKWCLNQTLAIGTQTKVNHSLLYVYKLNSGFTYWSNLSSRFYVNFTSFEFISFQNSYNSTARTLDIWNISLICPEIPEIDIVDESDIVTARWFLYVKAVAPSQTGELYGVPERDTEGNYINGNLTYNASSMSWHSFDNDIGLVYTHELVEHYVVIRFTLIIPVGYYKEQLFGLSVFYPYAHINSENYFKTRCHEITSTKPEIDYNQKTRILRLFNVRAYSDYKNTTLDYYEMVEKEIYFIDRRSAKWQIFDPDNIYSSNNLSGDLIWNFTTNSWYAEDIDISQLPTKMYYVSCSFETQNTNESIIQYGPQSDLFGIQKTSLPPYLIATYITLGVIVVPLTVFSIFQVIKSSRKHKTRFYDKKPKSDNGKEKN